MRYVRTKAHQHRPNADMTGPELDDNGRPLLVSRMFFACAKCQTVVWFDFREDGQVGDLYKEIQLNKLLDRKPDGLVGGLNDIE